MILRLHEMFDSFCYYNAWLFVGILTAVFKSHPWHGRMPAFKVFYERYRNDMTIKAYVRIGTLTILWIIFLCIALMITLQGA
jgi:hypothetical protein